VSAREADLPVLDLIVLGIGPDGHVASLFPGAPALDAGDDAICLGVHDSPKPPPERITLSLAVLRAARRCLLLATGASKADAVDAMFGPPSRQVPASLLRRERLTVIVDDAAAPPGRRP
jgi:6-phosphogluconolactonase